MANWAEFQEQLTGLPVVKRAKYGIHFQKGGEVEAHFVGKPCHYLDRGLWKPIDTRLLITVDGWYSSLHSDVMIHPDGRVRVRNSDYQQFTELPSAKAGKLAGDRVIREFPGGEQHLIMQEDGFKEEIHVFKPTFPIEKFIARMDGKLPSHYTAHPMTAIDANRDSYVFTGDVSAFGAWLNEATYPVIIDPDFGSTSGDGNINGNNADYATARATSASIDTTTTQFLVGQWLLAGTYRPYRSFIPFDTSSIGGGIVTQVNLKLFCTSDAHETDFDVQIVKYIITGIRETDYDGILAGDLDDNILANTSAFIAGNIVTSGNLNTAWVNKTGTTWYCLRSKSDFDGSPIPTTADYAGFASSESTIESRRPVLTVLYSAGGIPKHFMHYARLRG
jgi:hypothetical protein